MNYPHRRVWAAFAASAALLSASVRGDTTRLLLPLPVSAASRLAPAPDPDHFVFAVAGDNRATGRGVPLPPTAPQIFSEYRLLRPAFSLWTGDTIYGSEESVGEFPTDALAGRATTFAAFAYKGPIHPVASEIVPSRRPGTTDVRVTVPRGRSVFVTLTPAHP